MNVPQTPRPVTIGPDTRVRERAREVQLLLNVMEPDQRYQPFLLTDEATLFDAVLHDQNEIRRRLSAYFGQAFTLDLQLPIWRLVDEIRVWRPEWPEGQ